MRPPARRILLQSLLIILLGTGLGLSVNQWSPRGLPLIAPREKPVVAGNFIPLDEAQKLWRDGAALFLDAREPADFAAGHIGNALSLPALSFEQHFGEIAPMLPRDSPLVLYCDGKECELSQRLKESLQQLGYTNARVLFNGWTAWRQAGLPVQPEGRP